MFNKLFKHELASYMRKLLPIYIAIIGTALLCRLTQLLESDTVIYHLLFGSMAGTYITAIVVAPIVISILCIVRFYKNLFSGEGYLSFTLPVTTASHLWVKLLAATTVEVMTFVMSLVSVSVFFEAEVFVEILKAVGYLSKQAITAVGGNFFIFILEAIVILLTSTMSGTLLIYGCICLGQRAKKARIGWAVGIYFIHYFITQSLSSIISVILSVLGAAGALDGITDYIDANPIPSVHIAVIIFLVITLGLSTLYYFISLNTMKNKLNLE